MAISHDNQLKTQDLLFILVIFTAALILRILYLSDYVRTDIYPVLYGSDSHSYLQWAKDIASGDLWGTKAFMKWPLYAYFLGVLLKISRGSIAFVYSIQLFLGAINCVLVYFIAKTMFNRIVGFIAALLCVWYGLFIFYDSLIMYTSLSLLLNSLLFLFILNLKDLNFKNLFLIGIFLGLCTITQANIIVFGILAILCILWQKRISFAKFIYNLSFFLFGLSLIVGGVTLKNYLAEKDFVLIAGNIGLNFYLGNNPEAKGIFHAPAYLTPGQDWMFRDTRIIAEMETGRDLKTSEVSRFWFNRGMQFIKSNPKDYLSLVFKKFVYLFSPKEYIHEMEYYIIADRIRVFKILFMDLRFILPFCILGMLLSLRKLKDTFLIYLFLIALSPSIILFFVTARYRMAMVPILSIFASVGIFNIWETFLKRKYVKFAFLCAGILLVYILLNYHMLGQHKAATGKENYSIYDSHFIKVIAYESKSDYQNALPEAELAHKIQPDNQYVTFTLGSIYYQMNNFTAAEKMFKEVIRVSPVFVDAYYNLGLLYNKQRRFDEAEAILKKALFLDPTDAGVRFELGRAYKAMGKFQQAREEFSLAFDKLNRWRTEEKSMVEKELAEMNR
jgi:hypothetical protein